MLDESLTKEMQEFYDANQVNIADNDFDMILQDFMRSEAQNYDDSDYENIEILKEFYENYACDTRGDFEHKDD